MLPTAVGAGDVQEAAEVAGLVAGVTLQRGPQGQARAAVNPSAKGVGVVVNEADWFKSPHVRMPFGEGVMTETLMWGERGLVATFFIDLAADKTLGRWRNFLMSLQFGGHGPRLNWEQLSGVRAVVEPSFGVAGFGLPDLIARLDFAHEPGAALVLEAKLNSYPEAVRSPAGRGLRGYNSSLNGQVELNHRLALALGTWQNGGELIDPDWVPRTRYRVAGAPRSVKDHDVLHKLGALTCGLEPGRYLHLIITSDEDNPFACEALRGYWPEIVVGADDQNAWDRECGRFGWVGWKRLRELAEAWGSDSLFLPTYALNEHYLPLPRPDHNHAEVLPADLRPQRTLPPRGATRPSGGGRRGSLAREPALKRSFRGVHSELQPGHAGHGGPFLVGPGELRGAQLPPRWASHRPLAAGLPTDGDGTTHDRQGKAAGEGAADVRSVGRLAYDHREVQPRLGSWGRSRDLTGRLRHEGVRARTAELNVRSSDFRTRGRLQSLPDATDATDVIWQAAKELFERALSRDMLPVRLLGVGASKLTRETAVQRGLFDDGARQRQTALDRTVDAIRGQFGTGAIRRGSLLGHSGNGQAGTTED